MSEEQLVEPEEIDSGVKAEILHRRDKVDKHPELLEPWEGTTGRIRARLNELRRQKALRVSA